MGSKEHVALPMQGVDPWNTWRRKNPDVSPDLSEVDITGAVLINADFSGADLSRASLPGAALMGANLAKANFTGATLIDLNLSKAALREARFAGAVVQDS